MRLADKERALRRAIEVMTTWHERVPRSYDGTLPESIAALEELLIDVRQLPLPLAKKD